MFACQNVLCYFKDLYKALKISLQYDLYFKTGLLAYKAMMDLHRNTSKNCTVTFVNKF